MWTAQHCVSRELCWSLAEIIRRTEFSPWKRPDQNMTGELCELLLNTIGVETPLVAEYVFL
jgi:hypothetical protein